MKSFLVLRLHLCTDKSCVKGIQLEQQHSSDRCRKALTLPLSQFLTTTQHSHVLLTAVRSCQPRNIPELQCEA